MKKEKRNWVFGLLLNVAKSIFVMFIGFISAVVCIFSPSSASEILVGLSAVILDDNDFPPKPNEAIEVKGSLT